MTKDVSDEVASNIFAALMAGVQRHDPQWYGPHESGRYVLFEDVIAALAAAADPALLAEAGEHVRLLRLSPWSDGYPRLDELPDLITALLARIAAQEARIKGLEAAFEREKADHRSHRAKAGGTNRAAIARAEAAETALAAERAKVAKLMEEIKRLTEVIDSTADYLEENHQSQGKPYRWLRAAITEAGHE